MAWPSESGQKKPKPTRWGTYALAKLLRLRVQTMGTLNFEIRNFEN